MASYSPKTARHELCLMQMLKIQRATGGQIKSGNKGYPTLVFYTSATKYNVSFYDDTKAYVLVATGRYSSNSTRQQLARSQHTGKIVDYINYLFGG